jgi:hypothetical protein
MYRPKRLRDRTARLRSRWRRSGKDAVTVCGKARSAVGFVSSSAMLVSSARPLVGLNRTPTGCCMNEFAAVMKRADRFMPIAASQMVAG